MSLTIRPARAEELLACAALYERVAQRFDWEEPGVRTAESKLSSFEGEEVFVAHEGETLVGFLSLWRADNFVHSLFAEPQGRGIGPALLAHVAAGADGPLSLKCVDLNSDAQRFYRRQGFFPVDRGESRGRAWTRFQAAEGGMP